MTSDNGFWRITNKKDPIPINPGKFLGYHHPSGEVHIEETNTWDSCPGKIFSISSDSDSYSNLFLLAQIIGQDNPSELCIVGAVDSIFGGDLDDHDGPYDGVILGCD